MSRTLITIGTHANAGLNTFRMCFSKAQAVRILMARGVRRDDARQAIAEACSIRDGFTRAVWTRCQSLVQIKPLTGIDCEAYFARSYNELKALWQKAPEQ